MISNNNNYYKLKIINNTILMKDSNDNTILNNICCYHVRLKQKSMTVIDYSAMRINNLCGSIRNLSQKLQLSSAHQPVDR